MNKSGFNKYVRKALVKRYKPNKIEDANEFIDIFVESVVNALKEDDELFLTGFARFEKISIPSRIGSNPRTGAKIKIPAKRKLKFTPGIRLKDTCK